MQVVVSIIIKQYITHYKYYRVICVYEVFHAHVLLTPTITSHDRGGTSTMLRTLSTLLLLQHDFIVVYITTTCISHDYYIQCRLIEHFMLDLVQWIAVRILGQSPITATQRKTWFSDSH